MRRPIDLVASRRTVMQIKTLGFLTIVLAVGILFGCKQQAAPTQARAPGAEADTEVVPASRLSDLSPMGTVELLRTYREKRLYREIEPFVLLEQRATVIAQLRAVDRLVLTSGLLQQRIKKHLGLAVAQEFRYDQVANIVGIFSRNVTLLTQRINGDRATITYQVAAQLPIETAKFVRRNNRWVLLADPIPGVPEQILKLADLMERMARRIERKPLTAEELRHDLRLRQTPILRRIQRLITEAQAADKNAGGGEGP